MGGEPWASRPQAEMGRHWPEAQELESKDKRNQETFLYLCSLFLPRLVSSVQAVMASTAGYIVSTSCKHVIDDQ